MPATFPGGRKNDILHSARELFSEASYDGVSLDAIICHSETSKGTLYHYFRSKEDLYTRVLEQMLDRVWRHVHRPAELDAATPETYWSVVTRTWRRSTRYMIEHPEEMRLWRGFQESWRALPNAGPTQRLRARSLDLTVALVTRGQQLGCIRDDLAPRACAELIESLDVVTDGWFFALPDNELDAKAIERQSLLALDLVWRLLTPVQQINEHVTLDACA